MPASTRTPESSTAPTPPTTRSSQSACTTPAARTTYRGQSRWPGKLASPSWPAAPGPAWRGRQSAGLSSWIVPATLTRSPGSPPPGAPPRGGPGVVGAALNAAARPHGLMFGPDPASADRATFGGMIATNATGAHSIRYGMTADHLLEGEGGVSDGATA